MMQEQQRRADEEVERARQVPPLPPASLAFLSSDPLDDIPFLGSDGNGAPVTVQPDYESAAPPSSAADPAMSASASSVPSTSFAGGTSSSNGYNGGGSRTQQQLVVRLPPRWRHARDAEGRLYFYNVQTKESRWDPPEEEAGDAEEMDTNLVECETASLVAGSPRNNGSNGEEEDDSDDEEEEEGEEEDGEDAAEKRQVEIEILSSDLSAQEKELLLARRKRSKKERQLERRQKRERDREKREYERKKRRERHHKHRKSGLVKEHLIPVSVLFISCA